MDNRYRSTLHQARASQPLELKAVCQPTTETDNRVPGTRQPLMHWVNLGHLRDDPLAGQRTSMQHQLQPISSAAAVYATPRALSQHQHQPRPQPLDCFCPSSPHSFLWRGKSFFWHSLSQYHTDLHLEEEEVRPSWAQAQVVTLCLVCR